jgi:hypothetical protein
MLMLGGATAVQHRQLMFRGDPQQQQQQQQVASPTLGGSSSSILTWR